MTTNANNACSLQLSGLNADEVSRSDLEGSFATGVGVQRISALSSRCSSSARREHRCHFLLKRSSMNTNECACLISCRTGSTQASFMVNASSVGCATLWISCRCTGSAGITCTTGPGRLPVALRADLVVMPMDAAALLVCTAALSADI